MAQLKRWGAGTLIITFALPHFNPVCETQISLAKAMASLMSRIATCFNVFQPRGCAVLPKQRNEAHVRESNGIRVHISYILIYVLYDEITWHLERPSDSPSIRWSLGKQVL